MNKPALGVDIGGSGIKGALIDLADGSMVGERYKVDTPEPSTPGAVAEALAELVGHFGYEGVVGVGFPAVVVAGEVRTANNIDKSWVGTNAVEVFEAATDLEVRMVNDADAAALCEGRYGVARDVEELAIVLTFGSGIGSGFLFKGRLIRNVELGIIEFEGHRPAELHFSAKARRRENLSWEVWAGRANRYLNHVNDLFSPEVIAVGGGVARRWDLWGHYLDQSLPVVRAEAANNAGIIGAATLTD